MGKIIAFRPRPRAAQKGGDAQQTDAEILFFLGVRYLRMDDGVADHIARPGSASCGAPSSGGKRRRRARA